eukprot:5212006-Prymnesium_polylepis.1
MARDHEWFCSTYGSSHRVNARLSRRAPGRRLRGGWEPLGHAAAVQRFMRSRGGPSSRVAAR